jgi:metal-responsive CopG/Arc/MetJ family transcriptional regulator
MGTVLPAKGYESVNLPTGLYRKVGRLIEEREDLGYRSTTEFVAESVRRRVEEIENAWSRKLMAERYLKKILP